MGFRSDLGKARTLLLVHGVRRERRGTRMGSTRGDRILVARVPLLELPGPMANRLHGAVAPPHRDLRGSGSGFGASRDDWAGHDQAADRGRLRERGSWRDP